MAVFKPQGKPLIVPNALGHNMKTSMLPTTRKDFAGSRPATSSSTRFGQLSQNPFFTRHNPHPGRVRHIKGLNDVPICAVHDDRNRPITAYQRPPTSDMPRRSYQFPTHMTQNKFGSKQPTFQSLQDFDKQILQNLGKKYKLGMSLLDVPICTVHDDGYVSNVKYGKVRPPSTAESRKLYSYSIPPRINRHNYKIQNLNPTINSAMFPINTITGLSSYPIGFKEKADPKFGVIPMTDTWRDELREFTEKAGLSLPKEMREQEQPPCRTSVYSADTGRLIPSRSMQRGYSRQRQREPQFNHIQPEQANESLILEMLCQILQTDSISAVQSWLVSANHREKDMVLDMIRSAMVPDEQILKPQFNPTNNQPPSNMNLQNGYGEIDKFHDDDHTRYSRYAYDNEDGRKSSTRKLNERKSSSKADILRVHSPGSESPSKGGPKPSSQ